MAEPPMNDPRDPYDRRDSYDTHDAHRDAFGFYEDLFGPEDETFAAESHGLDKPDLPTRSEGAADAAGGEHWRRPTRGVHVALAAAMVVSGSILVGLGLSDSPPKRQTTEATNALVSRPASEPTPSIADAAAASAAAAAAEIAAGLSYSEPTALTIQAIGVDAPVVATGQAADGTPQIPPMSHPEEVGWYTSTVTPGEHGASVLWGHLDTRKGTAVFRDLNDLRPGDSIQVARADNRVATFTVERTAVYPRDAVPADALYDDPGYPALRLVTCGGRFDQKSQEYTSNIVVFARLASATPPLGTAAHLVPSRPPRPAVPGTPDATSSATPTARHPVRPRTTTPAAAPAPVARPAASSAPAPAPAPAPAAKPAAGPAAVPQPAPPKPSGAPPVDPTGSASSTSSTAPTGPTSAGTGDTATPAPAKPVTPGSAAPSPTG
jgi:hypothetical protein